jgi:hypothetical protein
MVSQEIWTKNFLCGLVQAESMKHKNQVIASAVCISVVIATIAVIAYSYAVSNPPKPKIDVRITSFDITGYNNPVGLVWNPNFVLNYTNFGTSQVDNLTLTFTTNSTFQIEREISVFSPIPPHYYVAGSTMGQPIIIESLKGEEAKTFYGEVWNSLPDSSKLRGFAIIATLKYKDTILDQAAVYLPKSENPSYDITCTYHKISSETIGEDTRLVLSVNASLNKGDQSTLSCNEFFLTAFYANNESYPKLIQYKPLETESIAIGGNNRNSTFQLTFQFPTYFGVNPCSDYLLGYFDNADYIEFIHEDLLDKDS